jgi:hypothetical protein
LSTIQNRIATGDKKNTYIKDSGNYFSRLFPTTANVSGDALALPAYISSCLWPGSPREGAPGYFSACPAAVVNRTNTGNYELEGEGRYLMTLGFSLGLNAFENELVVYYLDIGSGSGGSININEQTGLIFGSGPTLNRTVQISPSGNKILVYTELAAVNSIDVYEISLGPDVASAPTLSVGLSDKWGTRTITTTINATRDGNQGTYNASSTTSWAHTNKTDFRYSPTGELLSTPETEVFTQTTTLTEEIQGGFVVTTAYTNSESKTIHRAGELIYSLLRDTSGFSLYEKRTVWIDEVLQCRVVVELTAVGPTASGHVKLLAKPRIPLDGDETEFTGDEVEVWSTPYSEPSNLGANANLTGNSRPYGGLLGEWGNISATDVETTSFVRAGHIRRMYSGWSQNPYVLFVRDLNSKAGVLYIEVRNSIAQYPYVGNSTGQSFQAGYLDQFEAKTFFISHTNIYTLEEVFKLPDDVAPPKLYDYKSFDTLLTIV